MNTPLTSVRVEAHRIVVDHLELTDPTLAAWLAQTPEPDRCAASRPS